MFDQSHGLRFDIYERIHLSEELPGIAELEEVELLPEIQVIQREDRAELYGQLLLTGLYRSENDRTHRLEHAIPVEITVPLTRVSSIEDIGVEIENFDIDILTMRTVNITGVLSLRGIGSAEAQPPWQQEEYTVAYSPAGDGRTLEDAVESHVHENDALYENSQWTFGEGLSEISTEDHENPSGTIQHLQIPTAPEFSPPVVTFSSAQEKDKEQKAQTHSLETQAKEPKTEFSNYWLKPDKRTEDSSELQDNQVNKANPELGSENSFTAKETEDSAVIKAVPVATTEVEGNAELLDQEATFLASEDLNANEAFASQETLVPEEKPDLKIALGSKKEADVPEKEHLTFSSLLSSSQSRKEQEALLSEEIASIAALVPEVDNDAGWKSRFITGGDEANLFRKVRLCIVQREETLDTIAEKYQLSARELVMYNRLSGQNVEEGQVLYIP